MRKFAQLYRALDQTTKTNFKVKALVDYFGGADDADKVWAISLLLQKRPQRIVTTSNLKMWHEEGSDIPHWLFEGCYKLVGDISETIALILPNPSSASDRSLSEWIKIIMQLKGKEDAIKKEIILDAWKSLDQDERFLFNKLITGGFRISVPQKTLISALSTYAGIEQNVITHRLMSNWDPGEVSFYDLVLNTHPSEDLSLPYPIYSAQSLDVEIAELGDPSGWIAERKWDGIRGQLILRGNEYYLWSSDEELISSKFPELEILKDKIDEDIVIEGEILPYKEGKVLSHNLLQSRLGRKNITKKQLLEAPIIFIASDLIEYKGEDIRDQSLYDRRRLLESVTGEISSDLLLFSDEVKFNSWEELAIERENSRAFYSDGLFLKKKESKYNLKCEKGDWWIWKMKPFAVDAVLIYVQRGTGQKAKTYTEFTFAVKKGDALIPFTKASTGLSAEEIEEIALFVKKNTLERFGPVRSITPELVFEIEFEGIAKSTRHKSGIVLRFPRIKKWKKDSQKEDINTLQDLNKMLDDGEGISQIKIG